MVYHDRIVFSDWNKKGTDPLKFAKNQPKHGLIKCAIETMELSTSSIKTAFICDGDKWEQFRWHLSANPTKGLFSKYAGNVFALTMEAKNFTAIARIDGFTKLEKQIS